MDRSGKQMGIKPHVKVLPSVRGFERLRTFHYKTLLPLVVLVTGRYSSGEREFYGVGTFLVIERMFLIFWDWQRFSF